MKEQINSMSRMNNFVLNIMEAKEKKEKVWFIRFSLSGVEA